MIPTDLYGPSWDYEKLTWQERRERIPADYDREVPRLSYEEQTAIKELQEDWAKGINWEIEWQNTQDALREIERYGGYSLQDVIP